MPIFRDQRHRLAHHNACIALYRALLKRCRTAPLSYEVRNHLRNAIENRFKANASRRSYADIRIAFLAGYETLDKLDAACSGSEDTVKYLDETAQNISPELTRKWKKPELKAKASYPALPPEQKTLVVRPRQTVPGPRHVPKLVLGNGIPFLRFKKPQSPVLSAVISSQIKHKQKQIDEGIMIDSYWFPMARAEDNWDLAVSRLPGFKREECEEEECLWEKVWNDRRVYLRDKYNLTLERRCELLRKMHEIVEQERDLARQEAATSETGSQIAEDVSSSDFQEMQSAAQ